ncbi:MAG: hypothetical protein PUF31_08955 [Oscillospiraceae bacterium]|nr:hypothetical protein [Oscillospiraceae bacterium]
MEVRTPSDGFAATFPKGDGFYPDKLKFVAQFWLGHSAFNQMPYTPALVSPCDRLLAILHNGRRKTTKFLSFTVEKSPIF